METKFNKIVINMKTRAGSSLSTKVSVFTNATIFFTGDFMVVTTWETDDQTNKLVNIPFALTDILTYYTY